MDAFESLIEILLNQKGYWTRSSFKVELTAADKMAIGRPTSPRWEIDVVAFKGSTNEVLAIECKSFLDSVGVQFINGEFKPPKTYKLFCEKTLRKIVLRRLARQLVEIGATNRTPKVKLCMAAGHIASRTDRNALNRHMKRNRWLLFDEQWIHEQILKAADAGYENSIAHVVAKLVVHKGTHSKSRRAIKPKPQKGVPPSAP